MKNIIKAGLAVWIVFVCCTNANAQRKSLDISLEAGPYFTAVNRPILGSGYVGGEFEYFVSDRFSLASNLVLAKYYFQKYELDYFSQIEVPVERQASQLQSAFSAKYRVFQFKRVQFQAGAGVGVIVSGKQEKVDTGNGGYYISYVSNTDWGFPLTAEAFIPLSRKLFAGVKYGIFIQPDYPIMARQFGLHHLLVLNPFHSNPAADSPTSSRRPRPGFGP